MPTTPLTITTSFGLAATGPADVLIPARDDFVWAITAGGAPTISAEICPRVERGDQLSRDLLADEYLYVAAPRRFETSVTGGTAATVSPPVFSVQPTLSPASPTIGDMVTLTEGVAGPAATLTIEYLRLGGVDKTGELSGLTWDTTGESAGTITYRVRATNSGDSVLSDEISTTLSAAIVAPTQIAMTPASATVQDDAALPVRVSTLTADGTAPVTWGLAEGDDFSVIPQPNNSAELWLETMPAGTAATASIICFNAAGGADAAFALTVTASEAGIAALYGTDPGQVDIDWRFDMASTMTVNAGRVEQVTNQGGLGTAANITASGARRPNFAADHVDFTDSSEAGAKYFTLPDLPYESAHLFTVWRPISSSGSSSFFVLRKFDGVELIAARVSATTYNFMIRDVVANTTLASAAAVTVVTDGGWNLIEYSYVGGDVSIFVNGVRRASVTLSIPPFVVAELGKTSGPVETAIARMVWLKARADDDLVQGAIRAELADLYAVTLGTTPPPAIPVTMPGYAPHRGPDLIAENAGGRCRRAQPLYGHAFADQRALRHAGMVSLWHGRIDRGTDCRRSYQRGRIYRLHAAGGQQYADDDRLGPDDRCRRRGRGAPRRSLAHLLRGRRRLPAAAALGGGQSDARHGEQGSVVHLYSRQLDAAGGRGELQPRRPGQDHRDRP